MAVVADPLSVFDAVNVTLYVPSWAFVGVHAKVPEVLAALEVKVAPDGSGAAVNETIASPSGSAALTVKLMGALGAALAVAGAKTTGGRPGPPTTMVVVAAPDSAFDAVKVTE
jgi:hypothetical protein